MLFLFIYGAIPLLLLITVLTSCGSNNDKGKKTKKTAEKAASKVSQPPPASALKTAAEKSEQKKKDKTIDASTAVESSKSDEIAETKTAISDAEVESPVAVTAVVYHTAQEEDSFDRLQPRKFWVRRYKEIADAPKVNRKNAEYDTLKMFAGKKSDGFSQTLPTQG